MLGGEPVAEVAVDLVGVSPAGTRDVESSTVRARLRIALDAIMGCRQGGRAVCADNLSTP